MITDTRPALTARWRELERRGWKFTINDTVNWDGGRLLLARKHGERILHLKCHPPETEIVEIALLELVELYD